MFGRRKEWRRAAVRDDGRAHTFKFATCLASTVLFSSHEA